MDIQAAVSIIFDISHRDSDLVCCKQLLSGTRGLPEKHFTSRPFVHGIRQRANTTEKCNAPERLGISEDEA